MKTGPARVKVAVGLAIATGLTGAASVSSAATFVYVSEAEDAIQRSEDRVLLERAIGNLSPRQRAILYLLFYEDLSQAAIGERPRFLGKSRVPASRSLTPRSPSAISNIPRARSSSRVPRPRT